MKPFIGLTEQCFLELRGEVERTMCAVCKDNFVIPKMPSAPTLKPVSHPPVTLLEGLRWRPDSPATHPLVQCLKGWWQMLSVNLMWHSWTGMYIWWSSGWAWVLACDDSSKSTWHWQSLLAGLVWQDSFFDECKWDLAKGFWQDEHGRSLLNEFKCDSGKVYS